MCGLVGYVYKNEGGFTQLEATAFENLLYMDALRGMDATGVVSLSKYGDLHMLKDACAADYFLYMNEWMSFKSDLISKGKAVLGHNRKKTMGTNVPDNAHPFIIDNRYAFVHNGTLNNHKQLADTEVDSEALGIHLTKCEGDPIKVQEALEKVYGAYACMWIDQQKEHLYLVRNKDRPLFLAWTDFGCFIASEAFMIYAATGRNNIKISKLEEVEVDTLYTFNLQAKAHTPQEMLVMSKLDLSKKVLPLTHHTKGTNTCGGEITAVNGTRATAKLAKAFARQNLGKRIGFFMDDYVSKTANPDELDNKWLIWGETPDLEFPHVIMGNVNGLLKEDFINEFQSSLITGMVDNVTFNQKDKCITIHVMALKAVSFASYYTGAPSNETTPIIN